MFGEIVPPERNRMQCARATCTFRLNSCTSCWSANTQRKKKLRVLTCPIAINQVRPSWRAYARTHSRQRLARARMHIFAVRLFPRCCLFAFTGGRRRYDRRAMRPRCFARVQADIGDVAGDMMAEPDRTGHRMHQCKSVSQHAPRPAICRTIYDCASATYWCTQLHLCAHCH